MTDFTTLGLSAPMMAAVQDQGFTIPTEIQSATIPTLMLGNDVIGVAQTGGGKTAAFVLPMLERLMTYQDKPKPGMPRALILAPTRELAIQISETVKVLSRHTGLKNCTIFGGAPYRTQTHILRRGVDILVATPGRLIDHMKRGNIYLDEVTYFVLDEADRMLDMGFVDDVRGIAAKIRTEHQSVLFSATLNERVRELAGTLLNDPEHIQIAPEATIADNLTHKVMFVPRQKKHELLMHMIEKKGVYKALIFVRTKREADELAELLDAEGLKAESIHGDKQQRQRERIIRGFRGDRTDFLVATDVAARGIDVKDIGHVFNIDVPLEAESYVHRIGRTARGGASGTAYTFCCKSEMGLLRAIERLIKERIEEEADHPFPQPVVDRKKAPARKNRRPAERARDAKGKKSKRPVAGKKPFAKSGKPAQKRTEKSWDPVKTADHDKPARKSTGDRPFSRKTDSNKPSGKKPGGDKPFGKKSEGKKPFAKKGKPAGKKTFAKAGPKKAGPKGGRPKSAGGFDTMKRRA
ncbi:MAG: DEAD/DEAH box helicase [Alphaproteobacteria bacterium]|nr:DEAD/DEAH box helicase [Alphaproteobacteria bacterium]